MHIARLLILSSQGIVTVGDKFRPNVIEVSNIKILKYRDLKRVRALFLITNRYLLINRARSFSAQLALTLRSSRAFTSRGEIPPMRIEFRM